MKSNSVDNLDHCTHCGKIFGNEKTEQWETQEGEFIDVKFSNDPYICFDVAGSELILCEECYNVANLATLYNLDMTEVHFQFGLEYRDLSRFSESLYSLKKALNLKMTADILAEIANVYGKMGDSNSEKLFYHKALAINPNHFASVENLKLSSGK